VNLAGLSGARRWMLAALGVVVVAAVVVGVTIGLSGGASAENYCLYAGTNNQTGASATLAVPQPSATQSSCNALELSVQTLFVNFQTSNESFTISGVRLKALSGSQVAALKPYTSQQGWLVYSGSI
jgi:hypothetical protein